MSLRHFLIIYDHKNGKLRAPPKMYEDATAALAAYSEQEREHQGNKDLEIVLIGSDSLATVKRTHANYFEAPATSEYLKMAE